VSGVIAEPAVDRWEQQTEWPLAGLAVLFLLAYSWPILDRRFTDGW
jgi:voltage-gated potassium channel